MSDATRVREVIPDPLYVHHQSMIIVRFLSLDCFGCSNRYAPDYPLVPMQGLGQAAAFLRKVEGPNNYSVPIYEIAPRSRSAELPILTFLKEANAAGWRKITMYGKTLYICSTCRKTHQRSRPEWERRLTDD